MCGVRIRDPSRLPAPAPGPDNTATAEDGQEAIVLFTLSLGRIKRGVLVTYIHNLAPGQVPALLEALDEAGATMGLSDADGVAWGIGPDSPIGKALLAQEGRDTFTGLRVGTVASGGTCVGTAWYGQPGTTGRVLDTQMWDRV